MMLTETVEPSRGRRVPAVAAAVFGCGRTGSLVAASLRRFGARRITLIDPDTLEPHNISEMNGVRVNDVGQPKARVVATALEHVLI